MIGPGAYDAKDSFTRARSPGAKFGTSGRGVNGKDNGPGPGNYDPKVKGSGVGFSMKGRGGSSRANDAPGPGQYDADYNRTKNRT